MLEFRGCTFTSDVGDLGGTPPPSSGPLGLCDLAIAMSCRTGTLRALEISDSPLGAGAATALVGMLVAPECALDNLVLGGTTKGSELGLQSGLVRHFFQHLPLMKSLVNLTFNYAVPADASSCVLDGVRRNYSLRRLDGLAFEKDLDTESACGACSEEIKSYLAANARGRDVVARAVANPARRHLQNKAVETIRLLADSDDTTSLYLCLQMFLPAL
jgi:hypothetical protein